MVIDTMVFIYALLKVSNFYEESLLVLKKVKKIYVPDIFRAEFTNVLWQWTKNYNISLEMGIDILHDAEALITQVASTQLLWERALELSMQANHAAYDTLFVALAENMKTKVVTYDNKLKKAFPEQVIFPADFQKKQSLRNI